MLLASRGASSFCSLPLTIVPQANAVQLRALGWPALRSQELPGGCPLWCSIKVSHAGRVVRGARHVAAAEKKQKLMWEALREAVDEEMEADPTVCLMGAALEAGLLEQRATICALCCGI